VPVPTAAAAGVACRRPHAGLSADQADQPGDASTDPRIDLQRRSAIMGSPNRPDDRTHPADIDETELRQVQTDAGAPGHRPRDALVEFLDRREIKIAVQDEPHNAIRFALLPDVEFLQL
jgi:hypothetical protein